SMNVDTQRLVRHTVSLHHKQIAIQFTVSPSEAVLSIDSDTSIHDRNTGRGIFKGCKGDHTYLLSADPKVYIPRSGVFWIPRDTLDPLKFVLERKRVKVSFIADRGLGPNEIIVPDAHFKVLLGSKVIANSTGGEDLVDLEKGLDYTVEAEARDKWDLS